MLFHGSGFTEPSQESTQYAGFTSLDTIFPLVMLQESIHYLAIQLLERDMFVPKPSTEIGDHHDLGSDRVPRITLPGYSGSVSVKAHAQRTLAQPFYRAWKSENHRLKAVATVTDWSPVPATGRHDESRTKRASRSRWTQPSTRKSTS